MKPRSPVTRWITAGLAAATVLAFASTALADHGFRRYKGVDGFPGQRVIVRERSSSAGPAIAGLIGGFLLANALSGNAHTVYVHRHYCAPPVVEYRYYDPDGDDWYDSLDQCEFRNGGPRVVFVVDVRSGHRLRTLRYHEGCWNRCEDDAYDRYSRYDFDGRYDDTRYDEGDDR